MKNFNRVLLTVMIFAMAFAGCDDNILYKSPPDSMAEDGFYNSSDRAIAAINGAYATLQEGYGSQVFIPLDSPSDDVRISNVTYSEFNTFAHNASSSQLMSTYSELYQGVFRANTVLEEVPGIDMDETLKNRIIGEAKFLRALYYWHLTTIWGEVPLFTETFEVADDALVAKSPISDIYEVMIQDLQDASEALPPSYDGSDVGRATRGAAQALLGKVYLYDENYEAAEDWLARVIDSDQYALADNFEHIIHEDFENDTESIFEVQFAFVGSGDVQTNWHYNQPQGIGGGFGNQLPTQSLVDAFEDGDPRLEYSIFRDGDPFAPHLGDPSLDTYEASWSATGYNMRKGLVPIQLTGQGGTNKPIIRYADVLLMYAEAANELDMRDEARDALNEVRQRPSVDMPPRTVAETGTREDMFEAIVHERRVELAFEQARFNDLRRWGLAEEYLGHLGYNEERHRYFPLPQEEVDTNPNLVQREPW